MLNDLNTASGGLEKLALGTAQFGLPYGITNRTGQASLREVKQMITYARQEGVDTIDTAVLYGESETVLGVAGVRSFKVITKLPPYDFKCEPVNAWVKNHVRNSLARLRIDCLYGLILHRSGDISGASGIDLVDALCNLKKDGLVEKVGVSIYDPSELDKIDQLNRFDLVNAPYNLIDRRLEESGWLLRLFNRGIEVHSRSVFLQGLLLMPRLEASIHFAPWSYKWAMFEDSLKSRGLTAHEACISLPLSKKEISKVAIGFERLSQLQQVICSLKRPLVNLNWDFMIDENLNLIDPSRWNKLNKNF